MSISHSPYYTSFLIYYVLVKLEKNQTKKAIDLISSTKQFGLSSVYLFWDCSLSCLALSISFSLVFFLIRNLTLTMHAFNCTTTTLTTLYHTYHNYFQTTITTKIMSKRYTYLKAVEKKQHFYSPQI